jgi:threonine dehydrogenase-like Zn-dependent dehydrogenase
MMEALQFRYELFHYLASRLTSGLARRLWAARLCPLHHVHIEPPAPRGPSWTTLRVLASGICGTDLNMVTGQASLFLQPEATYPFVPGHELVGRVERAARGMRAGQPVEVNAGDRVAVWPVLGCDARESFPPCDYCVAGWDGLCSRRHGSAMSSGLSIGFDCATGGGWSEQCVAHVSQLWKLPDSVNEEDALLLDPATTALAALLHGRSDPSTRTLIIGGGTIGLLAAWLHRQLQLSGECELLVRHDFQGVWAKERGFNATVVRDERQFREWAALRSMPMTHVAGYGPVYQGHFDQALDAAGTRSSLTWALRSVRPRGFVTLVSAATNLRGVDPTPAWYRGLSIQGICAYGPVPWQGQRVHPYSVLIPRLAEGSLRLCDLITHQFPLREYVAAFHTALARARSGAIKVVFRPNGGRNLHE